MRTLCVSDTAIPAAAGRPNWRLWTNHFHHEEHEGHEDQTEGFLLRALRVLRGGFNAPKFWAAKCEKCEKWVFAVFSRNRLLPKTIQPKSSAQIFRIFRKIFGGMVGGTPAKNDLVKPFRRTQSHSVKVIKNEI
jgi:hypothetical protein